MEVTSDCDELIEKLISKTGPKITHIDQAVLREYAQRECVIHSQMRHPNVIRLNEYTECSKGYRLYMEYADEADYLTEKIYKVRKFVKINKSKKKLIFYIYRNKKESRI